MLNAAGENPNEPGDRKPKGLAPCPVDQRLYRIFSGRFRDEMWDGSGVTVRKMRLFNNLIERIGGEEGIRTLDTALDRITV